LRLEIIRTSTVPDGNKPGMNDGDQNNIMKLAEALSIRGGIQKDLAWIKEQFSKISRVPEGSKPPSEPAKPAADR